VRYNWNYFFPYVTISYATGQWFETEIWEAYHRSLPHMDVGSPERRLYRILMDDRPAMDHWVFWSQGRGGTWNNDDNRMFLWIGDHLIIFAMGLTALMGSLLLYALRCIRSLRRRKDGRDKLINRFKTLINTSKTEWARMMFVLQDCRPLDVAGRLWERTWGRI
jgi:mannosyltransferase OCH1-like enzyme